MALVGILRFFTSLLSLALLAAAAYLLWSWAEGDWVRMADGALIRVREDWRLWAGGALLLWPFLGRPIVLLLVARPEKHAPPAVRENGQTVVSASGARLYVETHGPEHAPPVIFTHGWGLDSTVWRYAKRDLRDRFRLVFWDLPGLGKSRPANGAKPSLEGFAADLASLLLLFEGRPAVLVGHSIGGMTIQTLLRDHPEIAPRIAGIALLNTTYTNPLKTMVLSGPLTVLRRPLLEPSMRLGILLQPLVWLSQWQSYLSGSAQLAHRLGFGRSVTRSQLDQSALLTTRNSPAVQNQGNLAMFDWDASGAMRAASVPVLVVGGEKDIITKAEASRTLATDSPNGRLRLVEAANHMGPLECAETYNRLIADFVLSVQPAARPGERSFAHREDEDSSGDGRRDRPGSGTTPSTSAL